MAKIRSGFVANSSSSSFIIAYRDINTVLDDVKPSWIKPMIEKFVEVLTKDGTTIKSVEELDKYFVDCYGGREDTIETVLEDDPDLQEDYDKLKLAIEKGYAVADVDVEYSDEWGNEFYSSLPKGDFEVPITLLEARH